MSNVQRILFLATKQKLAVAGIVGGVFFALSLSCCAGITWLVASDYGAKRERERFATEKERAIQDTKDMLAKVFAVPAEREKVPVSGWLTPDKAAVVDGIKIELVEGSIGKLRIKSDFRDSSYLTKEDFFQVRIRVTNNAKNFVLEYSSWGNDSFRAPRLVDEFDNEYRHTFHGSRTIVGGYDVLNRRLNPGDSLDDILAFDLPLPNSKEFRLELRSAAIGKKAKLSLLRFLARSSNKGKHASPHSKCGAFGTTLLPCRALVRVALHAWCNAFAVQRHQ